jgi:predicted secreted protein
MLMNQTIRTLAVLLLSAFAPLLQANDDTLFDTVSLSANAEAEVDNDQVVAVLFAEREGPVPAPLADTVNREVDWALRQLRHQPKISSSTPAYRTQPLYQKGRITGWRVRQTLRLQSADADAMSEMLGELQSRLGLQSVGFLLSPQQRQATEEQLINRALERFSRRAALVARQLGRGGYRLVSMQVNTGGVRPVYARGDVLMAEAAVAPPRLEGGTSRVQVTVSGTIQLKD